jgi:hypothetical protein
MAIVALSIESRLIAMSYLFATIKAECQMNKGPRLKAPFETRQHARASRALFESSVVNESITN